MVSILIFKNRHVRRDVIEFVREILINELRALSCRYTKVWTPHNNRRLLMRTREIRKCTKTKSTSTGQSQRSVVWCWASLCVTIFNQIETKDIEELNDQRGMPHSFANREVQTLQILEPLGTFSLKAVSFFSSRKWLINLLDFKYRALFYYAITSPN